MLFNDQNPGNREEKDPAQQKGLGRIAGKRLMADGL